jgi:hypothetical protein
MNELVPPHHNNPHTASDASFQSFDVELIPLPPGTPARPRPAGRERPKPKDRPAPPEQVPLATNYTALIQKDNGRWLGWIEQLAGVRAEGTTRDELLDKLRVALQTALDAK